MSKSHLINIFLENIRNGRGQALYSNCGWGYVYESVSENETIRVSVNQILGKENGSDLFFRDKHQLTIDEFNELSKGLPKRLLKIKTLTNNEPCTVRIAGSVNINPENLCIS